MAYLGILKKMGLCQTASFLSADLFSIFNLKKKVSVRNTISVSLDSGQTIHLVRPDLGLSWLQSY